MSRLLVAILSAIFFIVFVMIANWLLEVPWTPGRLVILVLTGSAIGLINYYRWHRRRAGHGA
jgi:hypothetical protein